jgi:hypothetical protein
MEPTASTVLKVPSLPPAIAQLARGLRLGSGWARPADPSQRSPAELDPLQEVGRLLRQAREVQGIGLRQLAQETRISTAVLEALERGWRDRLPEPTYLRTMLPLLERRLALPADSLNGALPARPSGRRAPHGSDPRLRRFTPGSIDVFTSWQGTLLYALVSLGLIQLLNLQQFRLAARGLLSSRPLPALNDAKAAAAAADAALLAAFPDLRPISLAASGQGLRRLRSEGRPPLTDLSLGILRLTTTTPTRLEIRSRRGGDTSLNGVEGELALPVLPPFRLVLKPAPGAGAVQWKGAALTPLADQPGTFAYPPERQAPPDGQTQAPAAVAP